MMSTRPENSVSPSVSPIAKRRAENDNLSDESMMNSTMYVDDPNVMVEMLSFMGDDSSLVPQADISIHNNSNNTTNETFIPSVENLTDQRGRFYVPESFWKQEIVKKSNLPYDVNGSFLFILPPVRMLKDQWDWGKYKDSTFGKLFIDGAKFAGKAYYQTCRGSKFCSNLECSYYKQFEVKQVTSSRGPIDCGFCSNRMEEKQCQARRYIGYAQQYTFAGHYGTHDCDPSKAKSSATCSSTERQ